jgi:hypothetical protein
MVRNKTDPNTQKMVWRISQDHPEGVFLKASDRGGERERPLEAHVRGVMASSLDLLHGAEVTEVPIDSLPGELTDAFGKIVDGP